MGRVGHRVETMNELVGLVMGEGGLTPADLITLVADSLSKVPVEQVPARLMAMRVRAEAVRAEILEGMLGPEACQCLDCEDLRVRMLEAAARQGQQVSFRARGPVGEA